MKSRIIRVWAGPVAWLLLSLLSRVVAASLFDPSFHLDPRVTGRVDMLAVQHDGKILVAGVFTNFTPTQQAILVRVEADGALDSSFHPWLETPQPHEYWGTSARISDLGMLSDGRIVVGRPTYPSFGFLNWHTRVDILQPNGAGSGFLSLAGIVRLAVDKADRLIVGGWTAHVQGAGVVSTAEVRRYFLDGTADPTFVPPQELSRKSGGYSVGASSVWIAMNGDILLAGAFYMHPDNQFSPETCALRLRADGSLVWKYGEPPWSDEAEFIAEDANGGIVTGRPYRYAIERLAPDGTALMKLGLPVFGNSVTTSGLLLEPDGRLLIPGRFASIAGVSRSGLAALKPDGTTDLNFDPGIGFTGDQVAVNATARQTDGKIMIGGSFTGFDGATQPWLVRLFASNPEDQSALAVKRTGSEIEISWPATASGFVLETAATLETEAKWQPSSASVTQEDGVFKATLPTTESACFFRLRK